MREIDRIKLIASACAMAADARIVIENRSQYTQEISDLQDAVDRFEKLLAEAQGE